LIVVAGLILISAGVVVRLLATSTVSLEVARSLQWVWFGGGGLFMLLGVFSFGAASARRDRPTCPHCNEPVQVRMHSASGRLQLDKQ
jgi:hypothetical protein